MRINKEKLFLQRYGEQSVRWQLCAPYRCKNKCLLGICFYSDIKHKSNNTTKHAQKVTSVVEFQAQKILAKIIQNNRLLKMTFKALKLRPFFGSHVHTSHVQIKVRMQFQVVALRTRTFGNFFFINFSNFFHQFFKLFSAIFQHFYGLVCSKTE